MGWRILSYSPKFFLANSFYGSPKFYPLNISESASSPYSRDLVHVTWCMEVGGVMNSYSVILVLVVGLVTINSDAELQQVIRESVI